MDVFTQKLEEVDGILQQPGLRAGEYDKHALKYDKLVSNSLYNKIAWGNDKKNYSDFARRALESSNGIALDIASGPLTFTKEVYAGADKPLIINDLSQEVLKIARQRIYALNPQRRNVIFLRADALNLPVKSATIDTVLCFGFLHLFRDPLPVLTETARILTSTGKAYFSVLVSDRFLSGVFIRMLNLAGQVAPPAKSDKILHFFDSSPLKVADFRVIGGMLYVEAVK